jgi:opacity protein-like surface antigen
VIARAVLVFAAAAVMAPAPGFAQSIGLRGYVAFGITELAANETFNAVAGTSRRPIFGGGVQVTNLWKGIFADVGGFAMNVEGERVFVDNGEVFPLGIPLEVNMRPVDVAGGWRLEFDRISPYAGAGLTYFSYEESSDDDLPGEGVSESKAGALVLAGVDLRLFSFVHAGGEVRYRRVTGILGEAGASAEFNEANAGGLSAAVRISIGR